MSDKLPGADATAKPRITARTTMAYRVPYADTDQMGVVYYANYLVYFERVRNEVLRNCGLPYKEMEALGIFLPVIEAHCQYRVPAGYDDALDIVGWFELVNPLRIKAHCEILRNDQVLASGHTVHVVVSSATRKPMRLSPQLTERIFGPAPS